MRKVHTIPATISRFTATPLTNTKKRRVAGYARVSTDHADQVTSYEAQVFSVKQISPFSSSEFPIVIVGKSPLSAGLVRKHVPLLHPAA